MLPFIDSSEWVGTLIYVVIDKQKHGIFLYKFPKKNEFLFVDDHPEPCGVINKN